MTPTKTGHAQHYPLNGVDLSFTKYHHRALDAADVMASHLMDAWLFPSGRMATWLTRRGETTRDIDLAAVASSKDNDLLVDTALFYLSQATHGGGFRCLEPVPSPDVSSSGALLLAALRRYVFETSHPELRQWLRWQPRGHRSLHRLSEPTPTIGCCPTHHYALGTPAPVPPALGRFFATSTHRVWGPVRIRHLRDHYPRAPAPCDRRLLSQGSILQDARRDLPANLWSYGPAAIPPPVPGVTSCLLAATDPAMSEPAWRRQHNLSRPHRPFSTTLRTRRARSEPAPGAYMLTAVPEAHARLPAYGMDGLVPQDPAPLHYAVQLVPLYAPCPTVSDVDHRTRRRSLSRRHVSRMFHAPSREAGCVLDTTTAHETPMHLSALGAPRHVARRCGWCYSNRHAADQCTMAGWKRCKCRPFPVYHAAKDCPIPCSRPCVDPDSPSGRRHAGPAMLCRARCCMCGIRGHSGRECRLKRCRCGEQHLGQDCGWKPQCQVRGCDRYLCGVHCRECGSTEKPFVGWRCRGCLANGEPAGEPAERRAERPRRTRRGARKGRCRDEKGKRVDMGEGGRKSGEVEEVGRGEMRRGRR